MAKTMSNPGIPLDSFSTFGDLLKYLRRRARLTQRELSIAVKYSEAQISRLEQNQRPPELSSLAALFIPALYIEDEPETITRLMELATQARGESLSQDGTITFSRSTRQETIETIETEFPSSNVPLPLNSFIGRQTELHEIRQLLGGSQTRLVTITGTGGCGKTRLSLETARELLPVYRDGVWLIELASITNPAFIPQTISAVLGAPEPREGTPTTSLIKHLRKKHLLLILDNCEQIILRAAQLAEEILRVCPKVQILATSREPFNVPGEAVFLLQPLSLPVENTTDESDSTRLFLDRARSVLPGFQLDETNASHIAQICRRLDGIPLAIELAVSRLSTLNVEQIAARLDDRFQLLTTGGRTSLPRQQTLRAAIDWSYNLLSEQDQERFRKLAVFSSGFYLAAASAVMDETSESTDALDVITRFVEKSLLTVDRLAHEENRYRMLETVREYGREKLQQSGAEPAVQARLFHYFLSFAREADRGLRGRNHIQWMKRLEHEHDNLRASLEFALHEGSATFAQAGLQLAITLGYFWHVRGYHDERHDWLTHFAQLPQQPRQTKEYAHVLRHQTRWESDRAKALRLCEESLSLSQALQDESAIGDSHLARAEFGWTEDDPSAGRSHFEQSILIFRQQNDRWNLAHALAELGEFAQVRQDDRITARKCFEESLQIARELEDIRTMALTLVHLGDLTIEQNRLDESRAFSAEGLVAAGELNDMESMSWGLDNLGVVAMCEGRFSEAIRLCTESLLLSQEWGNSWHTIIRRYWLARVFVYQGDRGKAIELLEENLAESRQYNFDWGYAANMHELGCDALRSGDLKRAGELLTESIQTLHKGHYGYTLTGSLDALAALRLAQGQPERAQILLSAADAYRESIHTDLLPPERKEHEITRLSLESVLSPEKLASLTERGRGMTHDEAIEFALG